MGGLLGTSNERACNVHAVHSFPAGTEFVSPGPQLKYVSRSPSDAVASLFLCLFVPHPLLLLFCDKCTRYTPT